MPGRPLCCPSQASPAPHRWTEAKNIYLKEYNPKNLCLYAALLKHRQLLTDGLKQRIDNSKKTVKNLCLYAALLKHHQLLTDELKQRIIT
jgi:hypothetical protein